LEKLYKINKQVFSLEQEIDPYKFYDFLLAKLNKELNGHDPEINNYFEKQLDEYKNNKKLEELYKDIIKNKNSIVSKLLYGIVKISIKCGFCEEEDTKEKIEYKEFNILDFDICEFCNHMINNDSSLTQIYLDDCLDNFFSSTKKYKENKESCPICKRNNFIVTKKIVKLPTYLVIRVNWGEFKDKEGFNFPIEFIKTTYEYLDNIESLEFRKDYFDTDNKINNEKNEYKLFSIINYIEEKNIFITKFKLKEEGNSDNWYSIWCNSKGKESQNFEDSFGHPYLLFYEKI
jgi:hypothetical protein